MARPHEHDENTIQESDGEVTVASLLPAQGEWSAEDFLWLSDRTNRLVEFAEGRIKVLPMPTVRHQRIVLALYRQLFQWLTTLGAGIVLTAPVRLRLSATRYREPDLLLLLAEDDPRNTNDYWLGADLVVEVLSPGNTSHDLVTKRAEYAEAGIPEYWIVDPEAGRVIVLALRGGRYVEHGSFVAGEQATSALRQSLQVDVAAVLAD